MVMAGLMCVPPDMACTHVYCDGLTMGWVLACVHLPFILFCILNRWWNASCREFSTIHSEHGKFAMAIDYILNTSL